MKLFQYLLKREKRSKVDILKQAVSSSELGYPILTASQESNSEVSFQEAVSHIPNMVSALQEVDYYA